MEAYLSTIEADFSLSTQKFKELTGLFQKELEIGLTRSDGMLKALPTFVYNLPKGSETGKYLTVDLGGTNLRIGLVELLGSGKFTIKKDSWIIPDNLKCGSGLAIFDFIAENIESFLNHPEIEAELPLKLGFTFSFPVKQESLAHGLILGWSKEIECKDVIGCDAVELLRKSLHSRGLAIAVEALINDTVGTLLAQIYRDNRTMMSVILGTGSNAAYVEKCSAVTKCVNVDDNLNVDDNVTVINIEWGSFGDGADNLILPSTRFDLRLDEESKNPGSQKFEKMISGMYLGEIFRLILLEAVELNLFTVCNPVLISQSYGIKTKFMSNFHEFYISGELKKCQEILRDKFGISVNLLDDDLKYLSKLCELISLRSCHLCAIGITAIHRHLLKSGLIPSDQVFSVALDGALYQKYPNYSKILQNLVCDMDRGGDGNVDSCRIVLIMADDLSSIGAAAVISAQN